MWCSVDEAIVRPALEPLQDQAGPDPPPSGAVEAPAGFADQVSTVDRV
jgi:hypothetical protein